MKKNLFILFILVSMLFPGCENELPYMNKPQVPQLLMNAFLEAGKEENGEDDSRCTYCSICVKEAFAAKPS